MAKPNPGWEHFRTFLAVIEEGSLSAAARQLGLTQPTAGRHIAAVEAALGTVLFTRAASGLIPTEAARDLRPHAEAMQAAAAAFIRAASGEADEPGGTVRITASQVIGAEVLPPLLAAFHRRYPRIAIELGLTNRTENLTRREADIAVRMVQPVQEALVVKKLGRIGIGLYATSGYLAARGMPRSVEALEGHSVIGFDRDDLSVRALSIGTIPIGRELFAFRSDSDAAQIGALISGFGIGGCQHGVAAKYPELVPVLPDAIEFGIDMWLAMHEDLRASRRVRLLFDHLAEGLKAYVRRGAARTDAGGTALSENRRRNKA